MNSFSCLRHLVILLGSFFFLRSCFSVKKVAAEAKIFGVNIPTLNVVNLTIPAEFESEACQKVEKGEGILIDRIIYRYQQNPKCFREINVESPSDIALRQTLRRDCNGKNRCFLPNGIWLAVNFTCDGYFTFTNRIDINMECLPIKPDNKHVFIMMPELSATVNNSLHNKSYLVLEVQQKGPTQIHCEIDGNKEELKFTLLHVDFGPTVQLHKSYGYINITDDKMKTINYTFNWLPSETYSQRMKFVSFDVSVSTGLVWIMLEDYNNIAIQCKGMDEPISTTLIPGKIISSTSGVGSSISMAGLEPTVTTSPVAVSFTTSKQDDSMEGVNDLTEKIDDSTAKVADLTTNEDGNVPAQGVPLEIVILVSAAGLLTMIVLAVCVACACSANSPFRRWKRRRRDDNHKLRYHKHDEYDYVTTDEVLDCTPDSALTIQTKKYTDNENNTRDCDYVEIPNYEETSSAASPTSLLSSPTSTTPLHRGSGSLRGAPLTPVRSSKPAMHPLVLARSSVPKSPDGHSETDNLYSKVVKSRNPVVEQSMFNSTINAPNLPEVVEPHPPLEQTEYSLLNHSSNQRNFENVYDG